MIDFELSGKFIEPVKKGKWGGKEPSYTRSELTMYLQQDMLFKENNTVERSVRTVYDQCRKFLISFGCNKDDFFIWPPPSQNSAVADNKTGSTSRLNAPGNDQKRVFTYLQLVCYILRKAVKNNMGFEEFFSAIKNPCQDNIPLYDSILFDFKDAELGDDYVPLETVNHWADSVCLSHEYIAVIAHTINNDYRNSDCLESGISLYNKVQGFFTMADSKAKAGVTDKSPLCDHSFLNIFYKIVARAKICALPFDLLKAYQTVRDNLTPDHAANGDYDKMLRAQHRKVQPEDGKTLAYHEGKIVEITASEAEYLQNYSDDDDIYLSALEEYIKKRIDELACKVFCVDASTPSTRGRIRNNIARVRGFWAVERKLNNNHGFLSKSKLISIYQAIFLSKKEAGFVPKGNKRLKTKDEGHTRQNPELSGVFLEQPDYDRDTTYHQLVCTWVDYLTLANSAPIQYATFFLDINIAALNATLHEWDKVMLSAFPQRTESILRTAARIFIRTQNDEEEIDLFCQKLTIHLKQSVTINDKTFDTRFARFGAFCRLFSAKDIAEKVVEEISRWDRKGFLDINITPDGIITGLIPPLILRISWNSKSNSLVLEDFGESR